MKISEEEVRHVAKLARLGLSDKEVGRLSSQLSAVFEYMEILEEVDVTGVKETSQVTGLENVKEVDEVGVWKVGAGLVGADGVSVVVGGEELLKCSELPVESKQILVKAAITKK